MGHCVGAIVSYYQEQIDSIAEHHCEHGIDYYTLFDDNKIPPSAGLVLKDGVTNCNMYIADDGKSYAYKAQMQEVDWEKTFENNPFYMFLDYRMCIDQYDFYNKETKQVNKTAFYDFFYNRLEEDGYIALADVHI